MTRRPGPITLVPHTHWDREWYQPYEVFRAQLVQVVDEALDLLERDSRLHFTLDGQMAMVEDYLELRPQGRSRIRALVLQGRLHIGPWYTASDSLLVDGETLLRNLLRGTRAAAALGGATPIGYLPDQFGHAAQLPQMFRLCGIEAAVLWRGVGPERPPHAFKWVAPDGSAVTTVWLEDGYASGRRIPSEAAAFVGAIERMGERLAPWLDGAPLLCPVGDDHVRIAAWVPDAARELAARHPEIEVSIGGLAAHVARLAPPQHSVHGELRSPAFAPVLAGVASARMREKQDAARVETLLLRYAEPLWSWLVAHDPGSARAALPLQLLDRAWRYLLLNYAHDSVAGCGIDEAHLDVAARYRWALQLAATARDAALAAVSLAPLAGALAQVNTFHPGPAARSFVVETELPRAVDGELVSAGPDGLAWPVQVLGESEQPPLFEGEFGAAELGMYLGGLDPATPLFGRYLVGIATTPDGPGRLRLDVGLGDAPVAPAVLAADQQRVAALLGEIERFRVVLHGSGVTRKVLLAAGAPAGLGFVPIGVRRGHADPPIAAAGRVEGENAIFAGSIRVDARPDGTVLVRDASLPLAPLRANDLVDEGDRGDLYHCQPVGAPLRAGDARTTILEKGPLRARMRIEQELALPLGLAVDRSARAPALSTVQVVTEVSVVAGERRVEFVTTLDNRVPDHRLRALVHLPFEVARLEVENALAVVTRPLDTSVLGSGHEQPAPTGQHGLFVDAADGHHGVALFSRGLREHELLRGPGQSTLALTLLRAVGWLARGDLACVDHAVGPIVATPAAQELGPHRLEYALLMHVGNWEEAGLLAEARRYQAPPLAFAGGGPVRVAAGRALVDARPGSVQVVATYPIEAGLIVRLANASAAPVDARLEVGAPFRHAAVVDALERPVPDAGMVVDGAQLKLALRPWQIVSLLLRS